VPQGLLEKIEIQLLLADFALQIGDLTPRLGQLRRPFRTMLPRQRLGFRRPATLARKRPLAVTSNYISPSVEYGSLYSKLSGKGRAALSRLHTLDSRSLEIPTEGPLLNLGHRSSFDSPVP
jgi:hypothetical protein